MLEVKNIHAWRGPAHILHGVSLSVRSHEVVCLVGRNGAGKTTTMESIMGFVPVSSGQILFHGEEVKQDLARAYRHEAHDAFHGGGKHHGLRAGKLGPDPVSRRGGDHASG